MTGPTIRWPPNTAAASVELLRGQSATKPRPRFDHALRVARESEVRSVSSAHHVRPRQPLHAARRRRARARYPARGEARGGGAGARHQHRRCLGLSRRGLCPARRNPARPQPGAGLSGRRAGKRAMAASKCWPPSTRRAFLRRREVRPAAKPWMRSSGPSTLRSGWNPARSWPRRREALGQLLADAGRTAEAQDELVQALALFDRSKMTVQRERVRATLFQILWRVIYIRYDL